MIVRTSESWIALEPGQTLAERVVLRGLPAGVYELIAFGPYQAAKEAVRQPEIGPRIIKIGLKMQGAIAKNALTLVFVLFL